MQKIKINKNILIFSIKDRDLFTTLVKTKVRAAKQKVSKNYGTKPSLAELKGNCSTAGIQTKLRDTLY